MCSVRKPNRSHETRCRVHVRLLSCMASTLWLTSRHRLTQASPDHDGVMERLDVDRERERRSSSRRSPPNNVAAAVSAADVKPARPLSAGPRRPPSAHAQQHHHYHHQQQQQQQQSQPPPMPAEPSPSSMRPGSARASPPSDSAAAHSFTSATTGEHSSIARDDGGGSMWQTWPRDEASSSSAEQPAPGTTDPSDPRRLSARLGTAPHGGRVLQNSGRKQQVSQTTNRRWEGGRNLPVVIGSVPSSILSAPSSSRESTGVRQE